MLARYEAPIAGLEPALAATVAHVLDLDPDQPLTPQLDASGLGAADVIAALATHASAAAALALVAAATGYRPPRDSSPRITWVSSSPHVTECDLFDHRIFRVGMTRDRALARWGYLTLEEAGQRWRRAIARGWIRVSA